MKELDAANGLNDTFVQEQQRKYIWEIWRKQDNSHSRGDMMSSDTIVYAEAPGRPRTQGKAAYSAVIYVGQ